MQDAPKSPGEAQDADVLELTREEQAPPAADAPADVDADAPVTEPKTGDAPGILFDEEQAERDAKEKKRREAQQHAASLFEIEDIDSVLEQYRQKFGDEEAEKARTYIDALQKASNDRFVIPKRAENSIEQAADDINALITRSPIKQIDDKGVHLATATAGSTIHYGTKGVQYNGAKKSFTEADAELLALHAAKRADLMPPSKVHLTGTAAEKNMIQAAIDKVNLTLPPEAQIVVGRTVGPSLMDNLVGRFRNRASGAESAPVVDTPAPVAQSLRTGADIDAADKTGLGGSFPDAAAGTPKGDDFIGPREFVGPRAPKGWTPPTPQTP